MHHRVVRMAILGLIGMAVPPAGEARQASTAAAPMPLVPEAGETKPNSALDLILDAWEVADRRNDTLEVAFERTDRSMRWGDQVYQGRAVLKKPDLACLELAKTKAAVDGRRAFEVNPDEIDASAAEKDPYHRFVWSAEQVIQYEREARSIFVHRRDGKVRWLESARRTMLPFLFNMKAAEAKARYGMTLLAQDRRPDDYLIAIVPREEIDRDSFQRAFVYLNKQTFLPDVVLLYPVGEKDAQEFRFTTIRPNAPIDDAYFHPPTNISGWRTIKGDVAADPMARAASANEKLLRVERRISEAISAVLARPPAARP